MYQTVFFLNIIVIRWKVVADICTFSDHGNPATCQTTFHRYPRTPKPSASAMNFKAMIAETQRIIIFKAQRNWTINSIDKKIEATIKVICIFRGHMVVLGAPGAPKLSDRAMNSRYMIAETHRSIISKEQPNRTINS